MELLVRASLSVRRLVRAGHGAAIACVFGAYVLAGGTSAPLPLLLACAGVLVALVVARARQKLRLAAEASFHVDLDLGLLLGVGLVTGLLVGAGGFSGPYAALTYLLVAFLAAFTRPAAAILSVLWILGLELGARRWLLGQTSLETFAPRAGLVVAFTALNLLFLRGEVARIRRAARARIEHELRRLKDDARSYRLLGAGDGAERNEDRLERSSVEEIQKAVHYALDLLRRTLDGHTAVLLWLNDAGTHLRISELSTSSDDINDAPFAVGDGVLGAAVSKKERVAFTDLKPSYKVPYYAGANPARVLLAIPIVEDGKLRGLLAIDRSKNVPFTPHEEELAAQAARYCLRAIQNERVFVQLERAKVEQGKLYRAAQALGAALSEKDVLDAGVRAAREIASFDLAAVTLFDETTHKHQVVAATSHAGEIDDLVGAQFAHNGGLVSMVVQNRFPLPYKGEYDASRQVVLSRHYPWPKLPSLLVLPLVLHGRPLGTLILGARRRHAFGDAVRPTLEVLASHLSVSLSNARMVAKLEQLATTDGLTGLLNKRAMQDNATQKVAAAFRFGRKLSVLITDIDFFKKVNDTYGHDVGDVVIKGLGEILRRAKRNTDAVARFGGEEFVIICEETDARGAMLLAERVREELGRTVFHPQGKVSPGGQALSLSVNCSIGVSTYPDAGTTWEEMFKAADEALYVSKRSGRDRSTAWTPGSRASHERAA
jgi:two-component system cell cycle response regulator